MRRFLLPFALAVLLVPLVAAHGAPVPRAQDTRLLHDHNDDCGGDGVTSNCRGTIDLIALDIQELYTDKDVLAFRFLMDKGQSGGTHKLTLTFDSPGGKKTLETTTTDQNSFASGGFDRVLNAQGTGDGTRYIVEGQVSFSKLGLAKDAKIGNFRVEARKDNTLGDFMPGGYQGPLGAVQDPPQGDAPTNYAKPDYTLRGPGYYIGIDEPVQMEGLQPTTLMWNIRNTLDTAQTITLRVDGSEAHFQGGGTEKVIDLNKKGTQQVHVEASGSTGTVTMMATSNLGGRTVRDGSFTATSAPEPTSGGEETSTNEAPTNDKNDSKGSPSLAPIALLSALFVLAARRRT